MGIQMMVEGAHTAEQAHRFEITLTEVNGRIAFLAGFVGACLQTDSDVQHILNRDHPAFRQRASPRAWEELRGLMVLRCKLVTHALEALGLGLTHQVTSQVERGLARKGIKPGADGFDLHLKMEQMVSKLGAHATRDIEPAVPSYLLAARVGSA